MIHFKRLDHVQICIPTGKEEEARKFYTNIIGLTEIPKPEALLVNGGLWYQVADIQLHIGTETITGRSKRHPAFEISNLDEARQHLLSKGVMIKEEIQIPGQKRFSFIDPFDNRIELFRKNLLRTHSPCETIGSSPYINMPGDRIGFEIYNGHVVVPGTSDKCA